jgi:hypothetical protein
MIFPTSLSRARRVFAIATVIALVVLSTGGCDPNPSGLSAAQKAAKAAAAGYASWAACEQAGACSE